MRPPLTPARFAAALTTAAELFEVTPGALRGHYRRAHVAHARQALMLACYDGSVASLTDIAGYLERDHTTVLYGIRQARAAAARDPELAATVAAIIAALQAAGPLRIVQSDPQESTAIQNVAG